MHVMWSGSMLYFLSCLLDDNDSVTNSCKCCVSVKIIYDKDSGRSRGFGFVHFSKEDNAESAKHAMDGRVSKELCFLTESSPSLLSKLKLLAIVVFVVGIARSPTENKLCSRKGSRWASCSPTHYKQWRFLQSQHLNFINLNKHLNKQFICLFICW